MSDWKVTAKDKRYAQYRSQGVLHEQAWRRAYKTAPVAPDMVPDKLLKLMGSTVDEFTEAHSVASIQELKQFWTEVLRDKSANMAARISAASELAKAKGVFAAANKKKPVEKEPMSDVETKAKIAQLLLERETE